MTIYRYPSELGFEGERVLYRTITKMSDSLEIVTMIDGEASSVKVAYEEGIIPFLEYTHWPSKLL